MADNKNQHFVPQFYLRNFSTDEEKRSIGLFNCARSIAVGNASIRSQCSRDYWHGDPDPVFEECVKGLEGLGAAAIRATILTGEVQKPRTLKTFIMFQLGRTAFSAEAFAESREKMHRLAYGKPPEPVELDPKHTIGLYLMNEPILRDMAACLVVNKTDIDFITSDNPVALCNWWFHNIYRKRPGPGIGLAQAGLEIYLPLSPKHQLILYDRNLWSVPKATKAGTVVLKSAQDVFALNERQLLNAQHNVYFAPTKQTIEHVAYLAKECADRRKKKKVNVVEWVQSKDHPDKFVRPGSPDAAPEIREKIISTSPNEIKPARRVTLFSKHFWPRYDEHPSAVGALRDLAWMEIVENFREALEKNRNMKPDDLDDYVVAHPLIHAVKAWKHEYWEERRVS